MLLLVDHLAAGVVVGVVDVVVAVGAFGIVFVFLDPALFSAGGVVEGYGACGVLVVSLVGVFFSLFFDAGGG